MYKNRMPVSEFVMLGVYMFFLLIVIVFSIGINGIVNIKMFEYLFYISLFLVPLVLSALNCYYVYKGMKYTILEYAPFVNAIFIVVIICSKLAIQLDVISIWMTLISLIAFSAVQAMMMLVHKETKDNLKLRIRNYLLSYFYLLMFDIVMIILTFDYSIIV